MRIYIFPILVWAILASASVWALNRVENTLPMSTASGIGSNGNTVSIFTGAVNYINTDNDSTTVGNSFSGSYYDSTYGSFKLDWSNNKSQNVRFMRATSRCPSGFGYELWGLAQSGLGGYMNFAPSATNYVYYCEATGQLYGFAYSTTLGWQNFNGIRLVAFSQSNIITTGLSSLNDPFNFNRTTTVNTESMSKIQGDRSGTAQGEESVFYIVK